MSLLIVRAPLKPFNGTHANAPGDWQDTAYLESFEWCLLEDLKQAGNQALVYQSGIGSVESMPYADQALVLMPTLDVRLIEAKVPLANSKKLQQILSNLVEEYLLGSAESLTMQLLPPISGKPALQRVIALIDRTWYARLTKQLEDLLSPRVRLIPDCLILNMATSDESAFTPSPVGAPSISFMRDAGNLIFTRRTGEQLGLSWVEKEILEQEIILPSAFGAERIMEVSWDWIAPCAKAFIERNASSKAANFSLNLLPQQFRKNTTQSALSKLSQYSSIFGRQGADAHGATQESGLSWFDPAVWRRSRYWFGFALASMLLGFSVHLVWLVLDNWRWEKRMELIAAQSLSPASVSTLNKSHANPTYSDVMNAFIRQATQEQRRQGVVSDVDFSVMAAKLQQLKVAFGAEPIQTIDYDGYGIDFQFKPNTVRQTPEQVVQQANLLGLAVRILGPDRYRLEPYSGLSGATGL